MKNKNKIIFSAASALAVGTVGFALNKLKKHHDLKKAKKEVAENINTAATELVTYNGDKLNIEQRISLAKKGNEKDLDQLISDPSQYVRATVAEVGTKDQKEKLLNDESEYVKTVAFLSLDQK